MRGTDMTRDAFVSEIEKLTEEKGNQDIAAWITWAEECVDAGQYVAFAEKPREEAVGIWLDSYVAVLKAVKRDLGADAVKQVISLSGHSLCLYPSEMEKAARLLVAGATLDELGEQMENELLERADDWPMHTGYDGTGELPPLPPLDQD